MRKWLPVTAFIIIAAIVSIYIFIPSTLSITQITPIRCSINGAYRSMATTDKWLQWWPVNTPNPYLRYEGNEYLLTKTLMNTIEVRIQHHDVAVNSTIHLLPLPGDSVMVEWKCSFNSGMNPFKRIQRYQQAVAIKKNMAALCARFKSFAEKTESIYGISIAESSFKDTLLIATKAIFTTYPTATDIYQSVNALKKFSSGQGARQTGSPLLNITALNSSSYQVMTALPVDKALPENLVFFKRQIPPAKFLVTQIQGGDHTIKEALNQLQLYIQDYHRVIIAIPFQQLITNRIAEPDTTKWITRIYVPVF